MDFAFDARTEELRARAARLHGRARLPGRAGLRRAARGAAGPLGVEHRAGARRSCRRRPAAAACGTSSCPASTAPG